MSIFNYKKILLKKSNYIIAEIGVNHECSLKQAKKLIFLAKKGGASAAKFQSYKAELLASKDSKAYWDTKKEKTKSQYELFSKYDKFDESEYVILSKYCKKIGIDFLSTPFDLKSVVYLKKLVPAFKISSSDITNIPLIEKIALTKKPILLSTGASNLNEIKNAIRLIETNGNRQIVLMHCILNYPTENINANLSMIESLKHEFPKYVIGYSDHTLPDQSMLNLTTAFMLGAKVIEKHFTINKKKRGNDHYHSMDFKNLKKFTKNLKDINLLLGKFKKKSVAKCENKSRKFARRSIVLKKSLKKGSTLNSNNLICLRPVKGIPASQWKRVLGKKLKKNRPLGHHLKPGDLK